MFQIDIKMALLAVTEALKKLPNDNFRDDNVSSDSGELNDQTYFCVEDTFLSKDINVSVEGVGDLTFPISEDSFDSLKDIIKDKIWQRGRYYTRHKCL